MAKIKVGINGFGRIGRLAFRASLQRNDIEVVAINDLLDVEYMAYMLRYDTIHGHFKGSVEVKDGKLVVNGNSIRVTAEKDPANLKWNEAGADYVIESTGLFLTKEKAEAHLKAGAKRVVLSAPSKDDTPMFVIGVNHNDIPERNEYGFLCILHNELPRSGYQGPARHFRHCGRPYDHRSLHYRNPEDC